MPDLNGHLLLEKKLFLRSTMNFNLFGRMANYAICASFALAMSCAVSGCSDERHESSVNAVDVINDESSSSVKSLSSSSTANSFFSGTWREDCLAKINEYRATENLEPLTLAPEEKQVCTGLRLKKSRFVLTRKPLMTLLKTRLTGTLATAAKAHKIQVRTSTPHGARMRLR